MNMKFLKDNLLNRSILILILCIVYSHSGYSQINVWATGSTEKVQNDRRSDLPNDDVWDEPTGTVKIDGVRGEHVPFQIVVTADHVNVDDIRLEKSKLSKGMDVIPDENFRLYFEDIIKVYTPSGIHGGKGYWPDALVPLTRSFNIHSGGRGRPPELRNQPVWADINIPAGQSPGTYKGKITVFAGGDDVGEINIDLTVWDITMPSERHFPALVDIDPGPVARMHDLDENTPEFRNLYFKYLESALDNRMDPGFIRSTLDGEIVDGNYRLKWNDEESEKFFIRKGLSIFLLSAAPPGISRESGERPFSETYQKYIRQYLNQVITHAKENNWYGKLAFLCPVDEPRTADEYEAVRRWGRIVKDVDPHVSYMVTEQPLPENPEWGTFVGLANYWVIHGNYLANEDHVQAIAERQKAGEKVIWYISCDQRYPQPNYFIDREAADPRMVAWITWRYKLGGILYWTSDFWREIRDPWVDPVTWKRSECNDPLSGEGSLIYPGNLAERYTGQENVYGMVSSIRYELLREGFEELELINLLSNSGGSAEADQIVESICHGIRDFTRDPNAIDQAREKIIQEILKRK